MTSATQTGPMRIRSAAVSVLLVLAIALPLVAVLTVIRGVPFELPGGLLRSYDQRTDGQRAVDAAQQSLMASPNDPKLLSSLGLAYLLRVRETGDASYYSRADQLVRQALAANPEEITTLLAAGSLSLGRHEFPAALDYGRHAVAVAPYTAAGQAIVTDALVELGRYDEAVVAAQRLVDQRPDLTSYSRVAYVRELHGDLVGATTAMRAAVEAGNPSSEGTAWTEVQLGHLLFLTGDLDGAEHLYESSRNRIDNYVYGVAGVARVRAARGDLRGAAELYEKAVARLPLPAFAAELGDVYAKLGDQTRADQQYALVAASWKLLSAGGVRTDIDQALFDADHDRNISTALAAARVEYEIRKTVPVVGTLAWAEYRSGDLAAARRHTVEALRLGTQDPLLFYRSGVIAEAAGDVQQAKALYGHASALNPRFSVLFADDLAARLRRLTADGG
ncbi:MAG: hypothetical protein NVS9B6_02020 [Candidatus Limnocylindrales bacterium]